MMRTPRRIPVDAVIPVLHRPQLGDPNHIDDFLPGFEPPRDLAKRGIARADDDQLGEVDDLVDRIGHEAADVRYHPLDVFAVPSQEPRHADIRVEQLQAVPLAQQAFDQLDQGALAKIVRARLEAEPENADLLRAFLDDAARRTFDLVVVAEHYALEERNGHRSEGPASDIQSLMRSPYAVFC